MFSGAYLHKINIFKQNPHILPTKIVYRHHLTKKRDTVGIIEKNKFQNIAWFPDKKKLNHP